MGLTAYGDESIRRRDVTDPVYLLGAYIEPVEGGDALVGALGALRYRGKLHWRDSLPRDKKRVCRLIGEHAGQHLVVAVAPLADGRREERARQQALMTLSVVLAADAKQYRVAQTNRNTATKTFSDGLSLPQPDTADYSLRPLANLRRED
ncbi:MAG: hypothetical protein ACFN3I_05670, partial [Arachnia propionica]